MPTSTPVQRLFDLVRGGASRLVADIRDSQKHDDYTVRDEREEAVAAKISASSPKVRKDLVERLTTEFILDTSGSPLANHNRKLAIRMLGHTADPGAVDALFAVLESPSLKHGVDEKMAAARSLSRFADQTVVERLGRALSDKPYEGVAKDIIWSLKKIGGPAAVPFLMRTLRSYLDSLVQEAAITALIQWPEAVRSHDRDELSVAFGLALRNQGYSPSGRVAVYAAKVLVDILDGDAARPILVEALTNNEKTSDAILAELDRSVPQWRERGQESVGVPPPPAGPTLFPLPTKEQLSCDFATLDPDEGPGGSQFKAGISAWNRKDFGAARIAFTGALQSGLTSGYQAHAHQTLGQICLGDGDVRSAVSHFLACLQIGGKGADAAWDAASRLEVVYREIGEVPASRGIARVATAANKRGIYLDQDHVDQIRRLVRTIKQIGSGDQREQASMTDAEMCQVLTNLCQAYADNNKNVIAQLEPEATKIGEALNSQGGIAEMRRIYAAVPHIQGKRTLDMHWGGIGDWRG